MENYKDELINSIVESVFSKSGKSDIELRKTIHNLVENNLIDDIENQVKPYSLSGYIKKIAITPEAINRFDFKNMKSDGLNENQIYELTVIASLSAGLNRYSKAINLIKEEVHETPAVK